ncbi:MAG: sugar phosphate isomerase/epimerase [Verrucomicrobiae bacterium]|nr:sugar phosphate isomerase/epimerase [Verrucomicrobiae bacterium]
MSKLPIGVIVGLTDKPENELGKVVDLGLRSCQVASWNMELWTPSIGKALIEAARKLEITITTFWAGYPGPVVWDLIDGPSTGGLVPPQYRAERVAALKKAADFAASLGLPSITTHVGFLPVDPKDRVYLDTVDAIREIAEHCRRLGLEFWFETGQETPVTLLRTIELVNTGNLGINLDPANLILYGMGNPVDALDVFGRYVRGVHAKDGRYPTNGRELGRETPLGEGQVNFAVLIFRTESARL